MSNMIYREPNYDAEQDLANVINEKSRHCRIGNVRMKTGVNWFDHGLPTSPAPAPKPPYVWRDEGTSPWWTWPRAQFGEVVNVLL